MNIDKIRFFFSKLKGYRKAFAGAVPLVYVAFRTYYVIQFGEEPGFTEADVLGQSVKVFDFIIATVTFFGVIQLKNEQQN